MVHCYDNPTRIHCAWTYDVHDCTVFTWIWLVVSPENFMLPSYTMRVDQFLPSISFMADTPCWLAQPQFLDTRMVWCHSSDPKVPAKAMFSWHQHCPFFLLECIYSEWNAKKNKEPSGLTLLSYCAHVSTCLILNFSLSDRNRPPLGKLLNLGFLLLETESDPNRYTFFLCWVTGTPEHSQIFLFVCLFNSLFNQKMFCGEILYVKISAR